MKLMKRDIPLQLLELENCLSDSLVWVKWGSGSSWSHIFNITLGVRQGSILSPLLFAVYIDGIGRLQNNRIGTFVVMYAEYILLLASSVTALQKLLSVCEQELDLVDVVINAKKIILYAYRCPA